MDALRCRFAVHDAPPAGDGLNEQRCVFAETLDDQYVVIGVTAQDSDAGRDGDEGHWRSTTA
jgi:hypothetical protein